MMSEALKRANSVKGKKKIKKKYYITKSERQELKNLGLSDGEIDISNEGELQEQCESFLNDLGIFFLRIPDTLWANANGRGLSGKKYIVGQPDIIVLFQDRFLPIELKVPSRYFEDHKGLEINQVLWFDQRGIEPNIAYSITQFMDKVREFIRG